MVCMKRSPSSSSEKNELSLPIEPLGGHLLFGFGRQFEFASFLSKEVNALTYNINFPWYIYFKILQTLLHFHTQLQAIRGSNIDEISDKFKISSFYRIKVSALFSEFFIFEDGSNWSTIFSTICHSSFQSSKCSHLYQIIYSHESVCQNVAE